MEYDPKIKLNLPNRGCTQAEHQAQVADHEDYPNNQQQSPPSLCRIFETGRSPFRLSDK